MNSLARSLHRFNFDALGPRELASSRLRAWMLADELQRRGLSATVNSSVAVDVQIFQKRVDLPRLREARQHGALLVLDIDDNVLLDDVGTKERYLSFMNGVDVVSVGSRHLAELVGRYHDHVILLDNPVDVPRGHQIKDLGGWEDRLGWFGNRAGLPALDGTGMREETMVVTEQGDLPWSLDTVDATLQSFDLVLVPVELNEWTAAKNAHRLLKCIALGVPALASKTPEHERLIREVGLPDWLLVEDGGDWHAHVALVRDRYDALAPALRQAAGRAWATYEAAAIVGRWLEDLDRVIDAERPRLSTSQRLAAHLGRIDVVVLDENEPELAAQTLATLRLNELGYRSVRVVSALPLPRPLRSEGERTVVDALDHHRDFFEVYRSLADALSAADGDAVLFLRAGVELRRGFFAELENIDLTEAVCLFALQRSGPDLTPLPSPPSRLDQLLVGPHVPSLATLPTSLLRAHGGLRPALGAFAIWELLIAVMSQHGGSLVTVPGPLAGIASAAEQRTAAGSYRLFLDRMQSVARPPRHTWQRLAFVWQSAVIEAHRETFGRYVSTVVPALTRECARLEALAADDAYEETALRDMASEWLVELAGHVDGAPLRLVRVAGGPAYLIDAGRRREVASPLLLEGLERVVGPAALVSPAELAGVDSGPPVVVYADDSQEHFLVAGGRRFRVDGVLLPWPVDTSSLANFELAPSPIELGPE